MGQHGLPVSRDSFNEAINRQLPLPRLQGIDLPAPAPAPAPAAGTSVAAWAPVAIGPKDAYLEFTEAEEAMRRTTRANAHCTQPAD